MAIKLDINSKFLNTEESRVAVHYLPAKVNGDGEANVDKYFNNYTSLEHGVITNALRGYPLNGAELTVPPKYKGVVLQEGGNETAGERTMRAVGTFEKFNYWNYDRVPSKNDAYVQALQIMAVAEELAKPIAEEDVLKEMEEHERRESQKENK